MGCALRGIGISQIFYIYCYRLQNDFYFNIK